MRPPADEVLEGPGRAGSGAVAAVARRDGHGVGKTVVPGVRLVRGLGVEGDAHAGETVKHRSRVRRDPTQPNLRQVHLIHAELLDDLAARGFDVAPGALGENVLTRGVDLLGLPRGARLLLGARALVEITGLRNPCDQLEEIQAGLQAAVLDRAPDGTLLRKAGVMAVVLEGGEVAPGDPIEVRLPAGPHRALEPV